MSAADAKELGMTEEEYARVGSLLVDADAEFEGEEEQIAPRSDLVQKPRRRGIGKATKPLREFILSLTDRYDRMTVRQVFYAAEVAGVVEKTERGYWKIEKQVLAMRREGLLAWSFITDGTRWQRKPDTWGSSEDYIEAMTRGYRRDLWQSQGVRIEVWLEKDALADVVVDATRKWDVALMVSRGQSSATFLHSAGEEAGRAYKWEGVATHIYALYDFDPGGDRAFSAIERDLPEFANGAPVHVDRLAVTPPQIAAWKLPTRPPKKKDPQAAKWGNKPCVELDAIPPNRLTKLVEGAITQHVDRHRWEVEQRIEHEEREGLRKLALGSGR